MKVMNLIVMLAGLEFREYKRFMNNNYENISKEYSSNLPMYYIIIEKHIEIR